MHPKISSDCTKTITLFLADRRGELLWYDNPLGSLGIDVDKN
jgi:hypothetical protein